MAERILFTIVLAVVAWLALESLLRLQQVQAGRAVTQMTTQNRPALYVFTSPTCGVCKLQQLPIIARLQQQVGDRIDIHIVDVMAQPEAAQRFGIWSVPTTVIVDRPGQAPTIHPHLMSLPELMDRLQHA